jgi:predicted glycoside hydrolase/deacetylase ChbG (UPF0249 family)
VVADDFGIGPATSRGIVHLCQVGVVTGTLLLVNSPFADDAIRQWTSARPDADLGWHPCLTLDSPVLPPAAVPSLVNRHGQFHGLGGFLARLASGRIRLADVRDEFTAQLLRFRKLAGHWPAAVGAHHHIHVLPGIGAILRAVLSRQGVWPYLRRVVEPWRAIWHSPGARGKRLFLATMGRREARRQEAAGYIGNDAIIGLGAFLFESGAPTIESWSRTSPGQDIELICHPGEPDASLRGRDSWASNGHQDRRSAELKVLLRPGFTAAYVAAGFRLVRPSTLLDLSRRRIAA